MKSSSILCQVVVPLLALTALACDGDQPPPRLDLLPAEAAANKADAEAERLRKMQLITVIIDGVPQQLGETDVRRTVAFACTDAIDCDVEPDEACGQPCQAQHAMCEAKTYLALTRPQGALVPLPGSRYTVPEQGEAAKQTLGRFGLLSATRAGEYFETMLQAMTEDTASAGSCASSDYLGTTLGQYAANGLAEVFDVYKQLVDAYVSASLNSADSELNSTPSTALAAARAMTQRLAAVKELGGEVDELSPSAFPGGAFCTRPSAPPAVRAAIAVIRDAAIDPNDLLAKDSNGKDLISTTNLIEGIGGAVPGGSVRQRLAEFYWGVQDPSSGATATLPNGRTVASQYSLDLPTFQEAREYLRDEFNAFARSRTAQLPRRKKPDGTLSSYASYAGTATTPARLPSAYYGALVRGNNNVYPEGFFGENGEYQGTLSYSSAFTRFVTLAQTTIGKNLVSQTLDDAAIGPLALMVGSHEVQGFVYSRPAYDETGLVGRIAFVYSGDGDRLLAADGLKLAMTEDDLRCAVQGTVEGAPCSLAGLVGFTDSSMASPEDFYTSVAASAVVGLDNSHAYLLRPRVVAATASQNTLPAGSYEAIAGIALGGGASGFPIVQGNEDRIAALIEPGRDWCARPRETCAGGTFDQRIALENELSDDGNGFEDSWKHYLDLAKAAAAEADQLGSDYINESLGSVQNTVSEERAREQQLVQANSQLARLQQLCGFTSDTASLLKLFTDESGNIVTTGASCDDGLSLPVCAPGFRCKGFNGTDLGVCSFDIDDFLKAHNSDPDIKRIEECISQSDTVPFVSLGNAPLCLWVNGNNPNLVCKDQDGNDVGRSACPQVLTEDKIATLRGQGVLDVTTTDALDRAQIEEACADQLSGLAPSNSSVKASQPLGYFDVVSEPPPAGKTNPLYNQVRLLTGFGGLPGAIAASNILSPSALLHVIEGLDWESRIDGYAAITYQGREIYTTGDSKTGPSQSMKWPCATVDKPSKQLIVPDQPNSFDCSSESGRELAHVAMYKAFMAAKVLGASEDLKLYENNSQMPAGLIRHNQDATYDNAGGSVVFSCGTNDHQTPKCDGAQAITRANGKAAIKRSCETGTAYSDPALPPDIIRPGYRSDGSALATDSTANLGCFHTAKVMLGSPHSTTDEALQGLSSVYPGNGWLSKFFNNRQVPITDTVAQLWWAAGSAHIPGGSPAPGSHELANHHVDLKGSDLFMGLGLLMKSLQMEDELANPFVTLANPPEVKSVDDLEATSRYVNLVAAQIRGSVGSLTFSRVPRKAVDALRSASASGTYPSLGGEMAGQLSEARSALLSLHQNGPLLANEVTQIASDIHGLKILLQQSKIRQDISDLQLASEISGQITACANGVSGAITTAGLGSLGAAATCANAVAQIGFSQGIATLSKQDKDLEGQLQVGDFGSKFSSHSSSMQTLATQALQAAEQLDSALASIEQKSAEARNVLSRALHDASFQAQHAAEVSNVLANLSAGKQVRYSAALENAKRLTFVAKRAIEQRLGVQLAQLKTPYPLVEAPASWESTLCSMTGVNYADLTLKPEEGGPMSFSEGFIGDYVRKLENFVESYTLENNFHEGTDTAVISLRDDIMNVRKSCATGTPNMLYNAGQLDLSILPGWFRDGCPTQTVEGVEQPKPDCILVSPATSTPFFQDSSATKGVKGYSVNFAASSSSTSSILQSVSLPPGLFRFTWYTKEATSGSSWTGGAQAGVVRADPAPATLDDDMEPATTSGGWNRRYTVFRLESPTTVQVGFQKPDTNAITLSAPMLEQLEDSDVSQALIPFVNTTEVREQILPVCQDSQGSTFRSTRWQKSCVKLCSDGFADHCNNTNGKDYCYWEATFGFNQRDIQAGKVFNFSGFARGNFNYRIDSVALNFVGTALHDCSQSTAPESCYGAGHLPYSLAHVGPFYVRNHNGDDVETKLFDGNVEHARGLASERYLTNPLSGNDQTLIEQYTRRELIGRPLDGNFVLRVWEEDGVDFNAIEDVQVVLGYRYWTKFD